MKFDLSSIRHPEEARYGRVMLVVGCLVWLLLSLVLVAGVLSGNFAHIIVLALCGPLFWLVTSKARAPMRACMIGHFVKQSPQQFPRLHQMVEEGAGPSGSGKHPSVTGAPRAYRHIAPRRIGVACTVNDEKRGYGHWAGGSPC